MSCSLTDRPVISIFERQSFPLKKKIGIKRHAEFKATKRTFNSNFTTLRVKMRRSLRRKIYETDALLLQTSRVHSVLSVESTIIGTCTVISPALLF